MTGRLRVSELKTELWAKPTEVETTISP